MKIVRGSIWYAAVTDGCCCTGPPSGSDVQ